MSKKCPKCGQDNFDNAVFCNGCGSKFEEQQTAPNVPPAGNANPVQEPRFEQQPQPAAPVAKKEPKQVTMNKKLVIGIGVAIAVIIALLVVLIIVMTNKDSGNDSSKKAADNTTAEERTEAATWEDDGDDSDSAASTGSVSTSDIKVLNEYNRKSSDSFYKYVVVRNDSKAVAEINGEGKAYDANKKVIGTTEAGTINLDPGATSILLFYFDGVKNIKSADYNLEVEESEYYAPGIKSLKSKYEKVGKDKIIVTVQNTGNRDLKYVEGEFLFFKGNKLVESNSEYFTDSKDVLPKGKSIVKEVNCYEDFDSVKMYFTDSTSTD